MWVSIVLLLKLFWSFDIFQNNKLGKIKSNQTNQTENRNCGWGQAFGPLPAL